jgi:cytochrome P450
VLDDIEIDGTTVPRGAEIAMLFGSANHDPAVFDAPEKLDLTRQENPHISFSAGIHYCIGAPLARIELAASMTALLEKAPTLTLATEPKRKPNFVIRGLEGLQVEVAVA